jgi:hypothetical protein
MFGIFLSPQRRDGIIHILRTSHNKILRIFGPNMKEMTRQWAREYRLVSNCLRKIYSLPVSRHSSLSETLISKKVSSNLKSPSPRLKKPLHMWDNWDEWRGEFVQNFGFRDSFKTGNKENTKLILREMICEYANSSELSKDSYRFISFWLRALNYTLPPVAHTKFKRKLTDFL